MTRINVVPVSELSRLHLVAEYRELPRVFGLVEKAIEKGLRPDEATIPLEYLMGKGHVKFFYNKLAFLAFRHEAIVEEMIARGLKPTFTTSLFYSEGIKSLGWWQDWTPTPEALAINRERIKEKSE
jgi:deoxyribonuclease (pyrimidine dimer)